MSKHWWIALTVCAAGTVLWWAQEILTFAHPAWENAPLTNAAWIAASILNVATLISIPFALSRAFRVCAGNRLKTTQAVAIWLFLGFLLLGTLTAAREPLARLMNNDWARFYPISANSPTMKSHYNEGLAPFQSRWHSGSIIAEEAACIALGALGLGVTGFYSRRGGYRAGVVGAIWLAAVVIAGTWGLGLMSWDYDTFFSGTLVPSVAVDLFAPYVACDPCTEIAFLAYSCLIGSCLLIERRLEAKKILGRNKANVEPAFQP